MKKTGFRIACIAALAAIAVSTAAEAKMKRITIGSTRQGSVFYLLSSTFAKVLQQNLKMRDFLHLSYCMRVLVLLN